MTTIAQLATAQAVAAADQIAISQAGSGGTNTNRITVSALFAGAAVAGLTSGGSGGTYVAGAGITITNGTIAEADPITTIGANLTLSNGTLTATGGGGNYTLPAATGTALGGVIVGTDLAINAGGTLNLSSTNEAAIANVGSNTAAIAALGTTISTGTLTVGSGGLTSTLAASNFAAINAGPIGISNSGTVSATVFAISQGGTQSSSWQSGPAGQLQVGNVNPIILIPGPTSSSYSIIQGGNPGMTLNTPGLLAFKSNNQNCLLVGNTFVSIVPPSTSTITVGASTNNLAFFGASGTTQQTVSGSRGSATSTVLGSLLTALAAYGVIVNSTSA